MAQHDQVIGNDSGANVRADINNVLAALFSRSSGSSAPSTTVAYQEWMDTTNALRKRRNAANSGWVVEGTLDEAFVLARSSNTMLDATDRGKWVLGTSTFTQTFDAAATLGDGWSMIYSNSGTGVITLDPNSSELINGAATLALQPFDVVQILCNGSALTAIYLQEGGWIASTPTPAATSGSLTSASSACRYRQIGKTVHFTGTITITTNGTGAGAITLALPVTATSTPSCSAWRENASSGIAGPCYTNTTQLVFYKHDNTYPGGSGYQIVFGVTYEAA